MSFNSFVTCIITLFILLFGLFFYTKKNVEGMEDKDASRCPNLLIQKGRGFYLYNTKLAEVPGVNPIEFSNLEDYTEFLDWQRSVGIRCPVLYLQNTYDAQGNRVYKVRPSVSELQGGLPPSIINLPNPTKLMDASRDDPPYNTNSYPGFDGDNQYIGSTTPLDVMNYNQELELQSPNPMDSNWGGKTFTKNLVDSGYYVNNEVTK